MKHLTTILLCLLSLSYDRAAAQTLQERYDTARAELAAATTDDERMAALHRARDLSTALGRQEDVNHYAQAILALADRATALPPKARDDTSERELRELLDALTDKKRQAALFRNRKEDERKYAKATATPNGPAVAQGLEKEYASAKAKLASVTIENDRIGALVKLMRLSEELGRPQDRRQFGKELVALAEQRSRSQPQVDLAKARHALSEADTDLKRFGALRGLAQTWFHQKDLKAWQQSAQEMIELGLQFEGERRVGVLPSIAKICLELGRWDEAARHAAECLELAQKFRDKASFGACVHRGNWVLGRVAMEAGRTADAKRYLLASTEIEGTIWAKYFPPNMSLAKELLAKDEREVVLQYLERCTEVWRTRPDNEGNFKAWIATIKAGKTPDFGASLVF